MAPIRKLYLDTRFRASGSHSDATFELAQNVEVSNQQSLCLGQMSFTNTLQTVNPGNSSLYWIAQDTLTVQAGVNDRLYFLYDLGMTGQGHIISLNQGLYTLSQLAALLNTAMNVSITCTVSVLGDSLQVATGNTTRIYFPTQAQLADPAWQDGQLGGRPPTTRPSPWPSTGASPGRTTTRAPSSWACTSRRCCRTPASIASVAQGFFDGVGFTSAVLAAIQHRLQRRDRLVRGAVPDHRHRAGGQGLLLPHPRQFEGRGLDRGPLDGRRVLRLQPAERATAP